MPLDAVQELLDHALGRGEWPPKREVPTWRRVATMRAFLEGDRDLLRVIHEWPKDRPYKIDPLPDRIATAWADYVIGDELEVTTQDTDQALLEQIVGNDFAGDLHAAERDNAGEGSQWWRVYVDQDVADVPLLEWHSRDEVIPYYVGRRLMAVALVTELEPGNAGRAGGRTTRWRHLEVHLDGAVEHLLFKGSPAKLGTIVPLLDHPETAGVAHALGADQQGNGQVWPHGLAMLMGQIVNRRAKDPRVGLSEFDGIEDFLLDLNELAVIGGENMRLTAKKRAVVPESAIRGQRGPDLLEDRGDGVFITPTIEGRFDAGEDLMVVSELDKEMGRGDATPFKVLEYSFDADALIAWKRDLVETALTRRGLTPQWVGVRADASDGMAPSGTSLRMRLIPTNKAGQAKRKPFKERLPSIVSLMAQVDKLSPADGGFGRPWARPDLLPAIGFEDPLPQDPVEDADIEARLVAARVRSRKTSIKAQHPEWDDTMVDDELTAIDDDVKAAGGLAGGLGLPGLA